MRKIQVLLSVGLMLATLALAALAWFVLPDIVIISIKPAYQMPTLTAKALAIGLTTAFGIGFAILGLITKSNRFKLYLTLSCLSLVAFVLLLIINK